MNRHAVAGMPETEGQAGRLYGRRRGHRLTERRQALVDELLPRLLLPADPPLLDAAAVFGDDRAIWLEIGFGAGEHLAWQAEHHPELGFVGAEPFINGVASLLAAVEATSLSNLRIIPDDVRPVLERFAPESLWRVSILFPDPWPKARHSKRRIIKPNLIAKLATLMSDGSELRLATDDMAYARRMLAVVMANADFVWNARRPDDWRRPPADWVQTRYEAKAAKAGRRPVYLTFCRRDRAAGLI